MDDASGPVVAVRAKDLVAVLWAATVLVNGFASAVRTRRDVTHRSSLKKDGLGFSFVTGPSTDPAHCFCRTPFGVRDVSAQ